VDVDDAEGDAVRRAWMWVAAPIGAALASKVGSTDAALNTSGCPGLVAHVTLSDYDGTHSLPLCVAPGGFNVSGGIVTLKVYDPASDGIFHNDFDTQ